MECAKRSARADRLRFNPDLLALMEEPSWLKQAGGVLYQLCLLLTGRLVFCFKEAFRQIRSCRSVFVYLNPFRVPFPAALTGLRSPPQLS